jgi:hypothetical protein
METHGLAATRQQVLISLEINVGREMRIEERPKRFLEGFYQFILVYILGEFLNLIHIHFNPTCEGLRRVGTRQTNAALSYSAHLTIGRIA